MEYIHFSHKPTMNELLQFIELWLCSAQKPDKLQMKMKIETKATKRNQSNAISIENCGETRARLAHGFSFVSSSHPSHH